MSRQSVSLCIAPHHPALAGHFPEFPVVPGVVLLDEALHAIEVRDDRAWIRVGQCERANSLTDFAHHDCCREPSNRRCDRDHCSTNCGFQPAMARSTSGAKAMAESNAQAIPSPVNGST